MSTCGKVDFLAELIGVKPRIWRTKNAHRPYCFALTGVELKEGAFLVSEFGQGSTPIKAKHNYATIISGRLLVVNASNASRREYLVPNLI